jgi:hypothetical protein
MVRDMTGPSSTQLVSSLLLAITLSGCTAQQTFRVVDATSGEPLGDVRVERLQGSYRSSGLPFVVLNELSPAEKQTTNESGSVTFQKSGSKFMVNPSHTNPAYYDAYVTATLSGVKVCYPAEHREFPVARQDGTVNIPLQRRWSGAEEPGADKAPASSRAENRSKSDTGDVAPHDDRTGIADTRPGK